MKPIKIKDIKTIITAPIRNENLVIVKVYTDQDGLYGVGCATDAYRAASVKAAVENSLKPLLIGRDARNIKELWSLMMYNSYWRNGPVLNNAVSGVDMALWDIKAKTAGVPLYDLLGGKCRDYVTAYRHCNAKSKEEIFKLVDSSLEQGFTYIRSNYTSFDGPSDSNEYLCTRNDCKIYDSRAYVRNAADLMESLRSRYGDKIELITDIHERIDPADAIYLAKRLEAINMFFVEDPFAPEDAEWLRNWRKNSATPVGMGEMFVNPAEFVPLIKDRLIDFLRLHPSYIGGITPSLKYMAMADAFGIRSAFHGSLDISPVGHAANLHMDLSIPNFGIQEYYGITEEMYEVFPGAPVCSAGKFMLSNDAPGIGVDIDEAAASKYPPYEGKTGWTEMRYPDGSIHRP